MVVNGALCVSPLNTYIIGSRCVLTHVNDFIKMKNIKIKKEKKKMEKMSEISLGMRYDRQFEMSCAHRQQSAFTRILRLPILRHTVVRAFHLPWLFIHFSFFFLISCFSSVNIAH